MSFHEKKNQSNQRFSAKNRMILTNFFAVNRNTNHQDIKKLEEITGLTQKQIRTWFTKKYLNQNKKCVHFYIYSS
jgi:hypothetical protein